MFLKSLIISKKEGPGGGQRGIAKLKIRLISIRADSNTILPFFGRKTMMPETLAGAGAAG